MLEIVPFQPHDQSAVKALILSGLVEHWGYLDESKNPDLDDIAASYANATFLVARDGESILGTGAFIPRSSEPRSAETVEIVRMSVARAARRQGIGGEILRELCRRAAQAGYRRAILETTAAWEGVVAFYLQAGFRVDHYAGEDVYLALDL